MSEALISYTVQHLPSYFPITFLLQNSNSSTITGSSSTTRYEHHTAHIFVVLTDVDMAPLLFSNHKRHAIE